MSAEIKSCPFCGGEAYHRKTGFGGYVVECTNLECQACVSGHEYATEAEAIAAWNTRTATTDTEFNYAVHDGRLWSVVEECEIVLVGNQGNQNWECSKCGAGFDWDDMENPPSCTYCPSCGAKVKEARQ